jgi:hypothetical protein
VTARGEDRLEAFSTAQLLSDPAHALLASTPVGIEPVGLQPFADGSRHVPRPKDKACDDFRRATSDIPGVREADF